MNKEDKKAYLKYYLGQFLTRITDEEEDLFDEKIKNIDCCLIRANEYKLLKKAICYILLHLGKEVRYLFLKSNDLLDIMLENNVDIEQYSFDEIQECAFLIIYHPKIFRKNKVMWETLNYLTATRKELGKPTIIISDAQKLYDEHGCLEMDNIINLSYFSNDTNQDIVSRFEGSSSCSDYSIYS